MWFMAWQASPEMHGWFGNAKPTHFFGRESLMTSAAFFFSSSYLFDWCRLARNAWLTQFFPCPTSRCLFRGNNSCTVTKGLARLSNEHPWQRMEILLCLAQGELVDLFQILMYKKQKAYAILFILLLAESFGSLVESYMFVWWRKPRPILKLVLSQVMFWPCVLRCCGLWYVLPADVQNLRLSIISFKWFGFFIAGIVHLLVCWPHGQDVCLAVH